MGVAVTVVFDVRLERHAALAPSVQLLQSALNALAILGGGFHLTAPRC